MTEKRDDCAEDKAQKPGMTIDREAKDDQPVTDAQKGKGLNVGWSTPRFRRKE